MKITTWPGLVTAASPYLIPSGAAVQQQNVTSLTPGQLTVRGGMSRLVDIPERSLEAWSYLVGSGQNDVILFYGRSGKLYKATNIGGTPEVEEIYADLLPDTPTSFAQGRRNEVYVFQGYGQRPATINSNLVARPIGMDPPEDAPVVGPIPGKSGYVARIDIIEPGAGYLDAPSVTIAPPADGRGATAVSRIADKRVSVIQVTDGGSGYEKAPAVVVEEPDATQSFEPGKDAELELVPDYAQGDHHTGIVYWERYLDGSPLGVTSVSENGLSEYGITFCTNEPGGWRATYYRGGLVIPVCTDGAGTGAKMWLPLTDLGRQVLSNIYPTLDPNDPTNRPNYYPNPCGENFITDNCAISDEFAKKMVYGMPSDLGAYFGYPQVFDFGEGYKDGDEIYAYIHTAHFYRTVHSNGSIGIYVSFCEGGSGTCPYVFKGYVYGGKETPPNFTIKAASPMRQRPLSETIKNPGSGYTIPPDFITDDLKTFPSDIDPATGAVTAVYPENPDALYLWAPEVMDSIPEKSKCKAQAILRPNLRGTYRCYIRYVNENVPESDGGPLFSSLSPYTDVNVGDSAAGLLWAIPDLPDHATAVELFRTTANQKTTIFRVARIGGNTDIAEPMVSQYEDRLSDYDLTDSKREAFLAIPVTLSDGTINANRYGVPSGDFAVGVVFQDRLFIGVDTTGYRPNTLMYSEADEPESMPEINELILQTNLRDTDYVTALVPYAAALVVFQSKACHRLTYVDNPQVDANVSLLAYRGCLNQRCWDMHEGVLYVMDDLGIYSMTESGQVTPISQSLDDLFRANTDEDHPRIDMGKRKWFFVRADRQQKVIRVHVSLEGEAGDYPTRQLCYSIESKSWWTETYPVVFTSGTECRTVTGEVIPVVGADDSFKLLASGLTDEGEAIPYQWKSGHMEFVGDDARGGGSDNPRNVTVTYAPTKDSSTLALSLFYNGSSVPRNNLVKRDRGVGFVHQEGVPESTLDMIQNDGRGDAPAIARALFSGRTLKDIYGNDRHVAVHLSGQQDESGQVVLYEVEVQGVLDK